MPEQDRRHAEALSDDEPRDRAAVERLTAAWQEVSAALVDSERRYRELVENSLGLICTHDLSGAILTINPAAATSLGYRREDGVGRNLADFLQPEKRHLFDDYLRRIQERGADDGLMSVVARDGSVRVWMYRNVVCHPRGQPPYVLGHAIDITERVAAERTLRDSEHALLRTHAELEGRVRERTLELEDTNRRLRVEITEREEAMRARQLALVEADEANRLKDEFLSTLSHELRTPLNAIFGWARVLKSRKLDASTMHAIDVIERNAKAQLRLIDDVLDVSRIITGKMRLSVAPVDVASIVRATIDTVRPSMELKQIRFDLRIPDEVPTVLGDVHRLEQVFWNLLSNALKFTKPGDAITATLRIVAGGIEFEIADTGVGIRRDVLPVVFDRFRQADSSTTRAHGGLGLGLAIVKDVVQLHGGSVRADSAGEGHGATFSIRLPSVAPALAEALHVPAGPHAMRPEPLHGRSVLIVEDHDDARELVAAVLNAAGAYVISASTTVEGVERATESRPDLLVADIGLPGLDGYELLARIRALYPDLPAMALSAYARSSDRDRALGAGFQEYGIKPLDPARLVEMVEATMNRRPLLGQAASGPATSSQGPDSDPDSH
jgi:PAS domain S-box-containing protein